MAILLPFEREGNRPGRPKPLHIAWLPVCHSPDEFLAKAQQLGDSIHLLQTDHSQLANRLRKNHEYN